MDRLLNIEPQEVVLHFEVGRRCVGMFVLRNLMHTMPVAFKVQTTAPKKYGVKPPSGIVGPLGIASIEILYGPHSDLPEEYPFIGDQFVVKSVVAPSGAHNENVPNEWFSSKKRQVYSDMSLRLVIVGGSILRNLVSTGSMENVREVLERDVNVDSVDEQQGKTAMHVAIANKRPEMVQLLLEFGANQEIRNKEGQTALQEAVLLQDSLSTELLLSKGAHTEAKNPAGYTALHFAVSKGDLEIVRILLNHDADVNAVPEDGRTPLYLAAANCDKDCVRMLMDQGARVDARTKNGSTALHKAAARGDMALVKLLLSRGAEKEALTRDGKTPYDLAAEAGHRSLYDILKMGDKLRSGSRQGDLKIVRQCVSQGASVDGQDQYGWSALHYASFKGHIDIVNYLIEKGADMECRDEEGYTALHCATEAGRKDVAQLLITKGANVNVKIKQGASALEIAQKMNSTGLIRLFSDQGDKKSKEILEGSSELFDKKNKSPPVKMKASRGFMKSSFSVLDRQCAAVG